MEIPLSQLTPEMILLGTATVVLFVGLARSDTVRRASQWLALLGIATAFAAELVMGNRGTHVRALGLSAGHISGIANYITLLTCVIGFFSVLTAWGMPFTNDPGQTDTHYRGEFFALMLCSLAGVSMIAKVTDLIWLFLALELVSVPTYIMVAIGRSQAAAQEAGVKYFFLGALSAAIYLFGFSYLYGFAGSVRFAAISEAFRQAWATGHVPYVAVIGLLLVIVGIAYKIAAVPLQFYAPDVYQGSATPVTAFLAFAPKATGFVALILVLGLTGWRFLDGAGRVLPALLSVMAVLTMTLGNIMALLQRNIKRIFAYSSIAHSGYMLVGLVAGPALIHAGIGGSMVKDGVGATLFYLGGYSIMNLGAMAALVFLQGKTDGAEDLDDIAGAMSAHPWACLAMTICLFSLIGMPGTIGFLGKLYIVQAALATHHTVLALIVVINAAIAAAYYLRIIGAMFLRDAWSVVTARLSAAPQIAMAMCTVLVVFLGIAPWALLHESTRAADSVARRTEAIFGGLPVARATVNPSGVVRN